MDFYKISVKETKEGLLLYPDFLVKQSKDLMVRGRSFYAVWNDELGLWSTDEYDVVRLVDTDLHKFADDNPEYHYKVMNLKSFNTKVWSTFRNFMQNISDSYHELDTKLVFADTPVKKNDYASRRLSYSLNDGPTDAWDELVGTLYSDDERAKIEWAIGAVASGDSKTIQKFLVFYGPAGSGKSTVLNIIQDLFEGYVTTFDAKALGSANNAFATEVFKGNPLVAIQHDGDLSKIDDNTKLNSIVSHEDMTMNEKYRPSYSARVNAFLFMGTNQPVKISDAKSGIIRRLIDVHPTGVKIDSERYHILLSQIGFEHGAIAKKCLDIYKKMGKNYYSSYKPLEMMLQTDVFYNFVEAHYDIFSAEDGVSLKRAYGLYKEFCADTGIDRILPQYKVRSELQNYFKEFKDRIEIDGVSMRSYYKGFKGLTQETKEFLPDVGYSLELVEGPSIFDTLYPNAPAQYANDAGGPKSKWANVKTKLSDIDTSKLHWVQVPENHIVIDFDNPDEDGEKDLERNIADASSWPPTYTELSQSGKGLHLHYIYDGDVHELSNQFDVGVEIKTLLGESSLRRKLTRCNNLEVATIHDGLPKKEKRVLDTKTISSEKGLREMIARNLAKEFHAGTKPSVDFIATILDEAYDDGLTYDVRDLRDTVIKFAAQSTNQATTCLKTVQKMKFVGKEAAPVISDSDFDDLPLVFFDIEVYPNLLVVCWKFEDSDDVVTMINPTSQELEPLLKTKLVGFNNRRYDNHILYARWLGWSLEEVYQLSSKIIGDVRSALFGEAYNLSYTDIYDFSSKKQSLKKFEIELGVHHMELDLPWGEPVPEDRWPQVVDYCCNDVIATQAVFTSRKQDFVARQILADLSGLSVNDTTQRHTMQIIFGSDKNPQQKFEYTDLSKEFKGYKFDGKESTYRGEITGEGGYVYAEPGFYENVALLDVASMHPTSIEELNLFGPYTEKFSELKRARMAIKHKDFKEAKLLLGGKLGKFLDGGNKDGKDSEALAYALKIVINIVYGLTSAKFDNAFRDHRNVDNIVAKRGALFMIDLKHAVQEKGFTVAHIKTDSIKIPEATPEIIDFVVEFGKQYGYDFEHEGTYDKFCLINDAVYVAREKGKWTAVGAQFQKPYVFKTLFTHEPIEFGDLCETKSVTQGSMYLDFSGEEEPTLEKLVHVGRTGSFVPVVDNGGVLYRVKDDRFFAVTGTKGFHWIEREIAARRMEAEDKTLVIDESYFEALRQAAFEAIDYYVNFESFVS